MEHGTMARTVPPRRAVAVAAALLLGCLAAVLVLPPELASPAVSNPAQCLAALVAGGCGLRCARGCSGRRRRAWLFLAGACTSWGLGQAYWWVAVLRGVAVPFPSLADVGFVGFDVLAAAALLTESGSAGRGRWQRGSDAVTVSAALGLVSWQTAVGAVLGQGTDGGVLGAVLLVGYPVLDTLLLALCLLTTAARAAGSRTPHVVVAAGLGCIGLADGAFCLLQATGDYRGGLVDLGWVAGFLVIAVGAVLRTSRPEDAVPAAGAGEQPPRCATVLPYTPVVAALTSTVVRTATGHPLTTGQLLVAVVVIGTLLVRQYLALRDNARLTAELAARERLLRHQALHDALTGLANRVLLRDRLEHALQAHRRSGRPLALVFLDLDGFKAVNDGLGHAAGDELLVRVAARLTDAVREGDTVARLGGDEFAVLLEDCLDPLEVAVRLGRVVEAPVALDGVPTAVGASIGVCAVDAGAVEAGAPEVTAEELLARSDAAMYAAKRAGGGRITTTGVPGPAAAAASPASRPPAPARS